MVFATLWSRRFRPPPAWTGWAATFAFCVMASVFFRSPNVGYAFHYLGTMFSFGDASDASAEQAPALFAGAALWLLLLPKAQDNPFIYFRF
jgi:D-alanyl-lipoteichoic acid acyltransferase DltB (MBOAT superfamily)